MIVIGRDNCSGRNHDIRRDGLLGDDNRRALTSYPSRDIIVAARQALTRQWWSQQRPNYRCFISAHVIEEAGAGDSTAAAQRLETLQQIEALPPTAGLESLAERVQSALDIPRKARLDAFHLAYAIYYELDYLLTWNCAHLANARRLRMLTDFLQSQSLWLPIICTPEEMVEVSREGEND